MTTRLLAYRKRKAAALLGIGNWLHNTIVCHRNSNPKGRPVFYSGVSAVFRDGSRLYYTDHLPARVQNMQTPVATHRMGAKTFEVKASHLSLISRPDEITGLVLEAAQRAWTP
jgi:hypothetical protein